MQGKNKFFAKFLSPQVCENSERLLGSFNAGSDTAYSLDCVLGMQALASSRVVKLWNLAFPTMKETNDLK